MMRGASGIDNCLVKKNNEKISSRKTCHYNTELLRDCTKFVDFSKNFQIVGLVGSVDLQSRFLLLVMKWKFAQPSKTLETLLTSLPAKFSFALYVFIHNINCEKQLHFGWNLVYLSEQRPRGNSKRFQYQILTSVKRSRK